MEKLFKKQQQCKARHMRIIKKRIYSEQSYKLGEDFIPDEYSRDGRLDINTDKPNSGDALNKEVR